MTTAAYSSGPTLFRSYKNNFLVIPDMEPSCLVLTEEDVPGASLGKFPDGTPRTVNQLTVPELRRWLACRGARRKGNKAELVDR